MPVERGGVGTSGARPRSWWRRFVAWAAAFEEAVSLSHDELQDRRLARIEREVADLKRHLDRARTPAEDGTGTPP